MSRADWLIKSSLLAGVFFHSLLPPTFHTRLYRTVALYGIWTQHRLAALVCRVAVCFQADAKLIHSHAVFCIVGFARHLWIYCSSAENPWKLHRPGFTSKGCCWNRARAPIAKHHNRSPILTTDLIQADVRFVVPTFTVHSLFIPGNKHFRNSMDP